MVLHAQTVEEQGPVPLGLKLGDQLIGQGIIGDIAAGIGLVHGEILLIDQLVKAHPWNVHIPVVEDVAVGVDEEGLIPRVPEGTGQGGHPAVGRGILEAGEGLPRPQEGGGDAGEELHLHIAGAAGIGVGQEGSGGKLLRQGVEVGNGVGVKLHPRQAGGVKEALRHQENHVGLGLRLPGLLRVRLEPEQNAVHAVLAVGVGLGHGALPGGAVQPGQQAQPVVAHGLALPLLPGQQGGGRRGEQGPRQQHRQHGQGGQPPGPRHGPGRMRPGKGRQAQEHHSCNGPPGARAQVHAGAEEAGHLAGLARHGQVADQQGNAIDRLLQVAGDGQEQAGQGGEQLGAQQAVGEGGQQQLGQQEHQVGVPRRLDMASHPRPGRRPVLERNQLAQVHPRQGQQHHQQRPPPGIGAPVPALRCSAALQPLHAPHLRPFDFLF